jgi:Tol biopolymer transport system component
MDALPCNRRTIQAEYWTVSVERTSRGSVVAEPSPQGHAHVVDGDGARSSRNHLSERSPAPKHGLPIVAAIAMLALGIGALTFAPHVPGMAARIPVLSPVTGDASPVRPSVRGSVKLERIVFASRRDGRYHLHLIYPDGSEETVLTFGLGEETTPAWSPSRDAIAFAGSIKARTSKVTSDIYIVRADGTGLVRLTRGPENDEDPSWSPDGTRIVFTSSDRSTGRTRIRIANVDGSKASQLPQPPRGCLDREPAWSPDGVTIAFARQCLTQSSRLFLVHVDGTGLHELEGFGRTPDWSPDGSKLAYTGWGREGPAIYLVNADGSGKVQLTTDGSGDPVWSPDGLRIAFTANEFVALKLFVINIDGSDQRPLTAGMSNETNPSW